MIRRRMAIFALLLSLAGVASAHRLDEYLQATIVTLNTNRVEAAMRLIPGVAVSPAIIAAIDTNHDNVFSDDEQSAYARHVLAELTLTVDGRPLQPRLVSFTFPQPGQLRGGLGEIHIDFAADLPPGGPSRRLILENHHQLQRSAYLINALVPSDPNLQITAQTRNEQQSVYQLDFTQSGALAPTSRWASIQSSASAIGFPRIFRLGIDHIAEGTDHLLFLLTLLLPAPLLVYAGKWSTPAGPRRSLLRILKIVTAFTLGHSITLALAAWGLVTVPGRPIEVLIAISILVSAIHALRPIFPGREAAIAAFFGLIHGLAFASTLAALGLTGWDRALGILAFNLGIETMQLVVVLLTLPSLLLMSRTRAYPILRIAGALFAGFAAIFWIAERLFNLPNPAQAPIDFVAHHAIWIAAAIFLLSLIARVVDLRSTKPTSNKVEVWT